MKTKEQTFEALKVKLDKLLPLAEIKIKSEIAYEINRLKKERNAVILGHNYMEPALFHSVPDFVGDSLELSRKAANTDAEIIIFCGVKFMAETAKILSPEKKVLLPAEIAGCSLASSITAQDVINLRKQYPGVPVIAYINTYADVKAEIDICCTSGNAKRVVESLDNETIIFLPDEYLAKNVAKETGRPVATAQELNGKSFKGIIAWQGKCEVHEQFTVQDIINVKKQFPETLVLAHPECSPEVVENSDVSASTSKMIDHVKNSNAKHFLILTECSMADNIIADNPEKDILRLCSIRCPHMNEITLENVLKCLREDHLEINYLDPDLIQRAKKSLQRMLEI